MFIYFRYNTDLQTLALDYIQIHTMLDVTGISCDMNTSHVLDWIRSAKKSGEISVMLKIYRLINRDIKIILDQFRVRVFLACFGGWGGLEISLRFQRILISW